MRYWAFFSSGGVPETGLSPTVTWRHGDGTSAGVAPTVVELDDTNAPGWYYFEADPAQPTVVTVDGTASLADADRYVSMVIGPDDFPQTNKRVVYTSWDARGNPTAGKILLYESQAALDADVDPWAGAAQTYDFTQAFDSANRPTEYTQGKA